jgi:hypothetical protein
VEHSVRINSHGSVRYIKISDDTLLLCRDTIDDVNKNTCSLFIASWLSLLADSPLNQDASKPFRVYTKFLGHILSNGLKKTIVDFSDLAHKLVSQQSLMGTGTSIGPWIDGFKNTPVFFEYHRFYQTRDLGVLRFLYTFLNFGKKLEYVDKSFDETAFRSWTEIEGRLEHLQYDLTDLSSLKTILSDHLPNPDFQNFAPKFGPGSVSERGIRGRIGKIENLTYDAPIDVLLRGISLDEMFSKFRLFRISDIIPDISKWNSASGVTQRISRLMFVPKNIKTSRSICMEPNTLMFFQQAILGQMLRCVDRSPYTRFFDVRNQERNKTLSLYGSYTTDIDTIDLSSASDSVGLNLVKEIFPKPWLSLMLSTRSHSCYLPNGDIHRLNKFAPMGSALCFPTQSLIFASVCLYAAAIYTYNRIPYAAGFDDWLYRNSKRLPYLFKKDLGCYGYFQPLAVYGDDICVDSRLTPIVKSILARLGFLVNETKSFTGSQSFRESCGGFYLDGHDITPLYFTIEGVRRRLTPSHVASHVHLINACRDYGFKHLKSFLTSTLMTWGIRTSEKSPISRNPIPFVSDPDQFGIVCNEPVNSHLRPRYNHDYQRDEVRSWTILPLSYVEARGLLPALDTYEKVRWWASRILPGSTEFHNPVGRYDTHGTKIGWRWIPV